MRFGKFLCFIAGLSLPLFSPGHSAAAQTPANAPGQTWVRIWAFADQPLATADVAIYDTSGHMIYGKYSATNSEGVFAAPVSNPPNNFRVVVRAAGGAYELKADFARFNFSHEIAYVNPVTTLVTDIEDKEPGVGLEQARARVRSCLNLPEDASLGLALRQDSSYENPDFSEAVFMHEAAQHGGVNSLLQLLAQQAVTNSRASYSFADTAAREENKGSVLKHIGKTLADGALYYLGGEGVGWVLQASGIVQPDTTAADIQQLQDSMADLQSSVDALHAKLDALYALIDVKFKGQRIDQLRDIAAEQRDLIRPVEEDLVFLAETCPPLPGDGTAPAAPSGDDCAKLRSAVESELNDPQVQAAFNRLATVLGEQAAPSGPGLLHLYSEFLAETRPLFFTANDSALIRQTADYWEGVQLEAADLYVERLHYLGAQNTPAGQKRLLDFLSLEPPLGRMETVYLSEENLIWPAVPDRTAVLVSRTPSLWRNDRPDVGRIVYTLDCSSPNPRNPMPGAPVTTPISIDGVDYLSPSRDQISALAELGDKLAGNNLWAKMSANGGFPSAPNRTNPRDFCAGAFNLGTGTGTLIGWTRDPVSSGKYWTWDTASGSISNENRSSTGVPDWAFYTHDLAKCEQYYWNPDQPPGSCGR